MVQQEAQSDRQDEGAERVHWRPEQSNRNNARHEQAKGDRK
jgi:hypothetical protein